MTTISDKHWNQVVSGFRQACILMREGKTHESNLIIHAELQDYLDLVEDLSEGCRVEEGGPGEHVPGGTKASGGYLGHSRYDLEQIE